MLMRTLADHARRVVQAQQPLGLQAFDLANDVALDRRAFENLRRAVFVNHSAMDQDIPVQIIADDKTKTFFLTEPLNAAPNAYRTFHRRRCIYNWCVHWRCAPSLNQFM